MVLHDIKTNQAICVIDPTAQLIKIIIDYIPKEHLDRVVYFNTSMPVPLDFFSYKDDDEKQDLITDISNIIDLSTAPIAKNYLRKIINALFEANSNPKIFDPQKGIDHRYTFFDIPRIVLDEAFRNRLLSYCPLQRQYDFPPHIKLQSDSITAIVIRLSQLTDSSVMKTILGTKDPRLNISDLINGNKIFLVDLKETESDQIIGSIIAAKIQHAIFARRHLLDIRKCKPYCLYIDECDVILKFAESRFTAILGRARKYNLFMTMANPIPADLPEGIQKALGKIGNLVIFNLDEADARVFKAKILPYRTDSFVNLPSFRALFRTNNKVHLIRTPTSLPSRVSSNADYVRKRTLDLYACNTSPISHNEFHGKPDPDDPNQARSAPDTRGVFRAPKHGRGTASPKADPD